MQFLLMLLVVTAAAWLLPARFGARSLQDAMRHAMAVGFVLTGVSHFAMSDSFLVYFPDWVPFPQPIVYASGAVEIAGGLALFARRCRRQVGLALAVYLVLAFPGNVYAAVSGAEENLPGLIDAPWYPWARLPFQALFVWWALWSTTPSASTLPAARALKPAEAVR